MYCKVHHELVSTSTEILDLDLTPSTSPALLQRETAADSDSSCKTKRATRNQYGLSGEKALAPMFCSCKCFDNHLACE